MLKKFLLTTAISIALIAGAVGANWSDPAAHNDGTLPTTAIQPIDKQILYILFIQKMNAKQNEPGKFGYYNTLGDCLSGAKDFTLNYEIGMVARAEYHITENTWLRVECRLGVWDK